MSPQPIPVSQSPSITLGDIYYVLFRHKWKIIVCSLLGFGGAAGLYKLRPPPYQSQAKILVRYILSEPRTAAAAGMDAPAKSPDQRGETIMNSEVGILTSFDLAKQVAEAVGPAKIAGSQATAGDLTPAAIRVNRGLVVGVTPRSSIIQLTFKHSDPEVAQLVLNEIVQRYFKRHAEIHRTKGMLGDFLIQETDQYRSRLQQTEEDLRKARSKTGVFAIDDSKKIQTEQMAALRQQIFAAEAELAQRTARLQRLARRAPDSAEPSETATVQPEAPPSPAVVEEYQVVSARLTNLQKTEQELLMQYTAETPRVRELRNRIANTESAKRKLEEAHPALLRTVPEKLATSTVKPSSSMDEIGAAADIAALQAKIKQLNAQFESLREEAAKIDALEGEIAQLRRKKELDESNYRLFASSLEQSRISDALSNGRVSNLTLIETPTPPAPDIKSLETLLAGIAIGGVAIGLGWAFLIEFYLDRSVRRPSDVERVLKLPLFLTIPVLARRLLLTNGHSSVKGANGAVPVAAALQPFYETLRDRLIVSFENRGLKHKPKLVAVTGLETGSGVSTIAAGLACSLSDTGGGNVLFVDMTVGQGSSQQFVKGKPVCGLDELLANSENAKVESCLYVVAENSNMPQLSRNLPQRFMRLAPRLKASDFDYIIFDLPPVSQISITPRIAGFMDMVLLVAESEHTDRESTRRAAELLAQSKAPVGIILNKTRTYIPSQLHREFLTTV